ncbi:unnamed protein product [Psylliodes chrysocephalus]|uniref:Uncharacterized protein n=1 Tax=Psylliodes chrysocephalus TaxID=3402493 RepID=A0A9P0DDR0_9CUCU|nr:unnamed protein product [Psylliodes chrysocephala]
MLLFVTCKIFRKFTRVPFLKDKAGFSLSLQKITKASVRRSIIPGMDEDDGDYATLRELPLPPPNPTQRISNGDDTASEEGKLLACVHDEHITYASTNQDFDPPVDAYEERSPLLDDASVIVHNNYVNQTQIGPAPRCLRRADSGMIPHEEIPGRSDSISTESSHSPPDPPGSSHSETSSGIHSNDSEHPLSAPKQTMTKDGTEWKNDNVINITENPADNQENTVVIRRKSIRPNKVEIIAPAILEEDPYGRCTNMRMTSFTDKSIQQSCSATLPHYPTQPVQNIYPNCSTMPLPQHSNSIQASVSNMVNGNSCNVYPRQHSTIPTHHNGVKLITNNINPYAKRLATKIGEPMKYEPIYTAINRKSGELYHYTS